MAIVGEGYPISWFYVNLSRVRLAEIDIGYIFDLDGNALRPKGYPMSRLIPGPHLGFYVAPAQWKDALAQLERLGIPNGDRGEEAKGRTPGGNQGTYMDDPAGYVIQYITEGMQ